MPHGTTLAVILIIGIIISIAVVGGGVLVVYLILKALKNEKTKLKNDLSPSYILKHDILGKS